MCETMCKCLALFLLLGRYLKKLKAISDKLQVKTACRLWLTTKSYFFFTRKPFTTAMKNKYVRFLIFSFLILRGPEKGCPLVRVNSLLAFF
jgi:hypothetical protein